MSCGDAPGMGISPEFPHFLQVHSVPAPTPQTTLLLHFYYTSGVVTFIPIYAILYLVKHILLCGNSIPLTGLAASLRLQAELTVIRADLADLRAPPGPDDVVIVDAAQAAEALTLLQPHPAWRLLCVDVATDTLTTDAAQSHPVHGMEEIVQVI